MENKIFCKTISVDHVKYGFDSEMVLHFYFHYKPFPGQTRKERDREGERRDHWRAKRERERERRTQMRKTVEREREERVGRVS